MNDLCFACADCKIFVDAGYRWCYWHLLKPGIVRLRERVDVAAVLNHAPYWSPPEQPSAQWLLDEVFPFVSLLFEAHWSHGVVFWEINDLPDRYWLDWLQLGNQPKPTARYFAEVARFTRFKQVIDWQSGPDNPHRRILWGNNAGREEFRLAFQRHVERLRRK